MTAFLIILSLTALLAIVALAATIKSDGYGHRPTPRSHRDSYGQVR